MLAFLKSLFARCPHFWQQYDHFEIRGSDNRLIGTASCCKCEKCGARRMFKMML